MGCGLSVGADISWGITVYLLIADFFVQRNGIHSNIMHKYKAAMW